MTRLEMSRASLPDRYAMWCDAFDRAVAASLRPGVSVLDVGSGRQPTIATTARPPGCTYVGLDISADELARAAPGSYDETLVSDIARFQPELVGRFDLVLSYQVFEHVRPLPAAFANAYAYLKPDGVLTAVMSGAFAMFALANRVIPTGLGRQILRRTMGKDPATVFPAHYDRCWYGALRSDLGGWTDVEVVPLYVGALYLSFAPPVQAAYLKFEEWAMRTGHRNLATHYVIRARKPRDARSSTTEMLPEKEVPLAGVA